MPTYVYVTMYGYEHEGYWVAGCFLSLAEARNHKPLEGTDQWIQQLKVGTGETKLFGEDAGVRFEFTE